MRLLANLCEGLRADDLKDLVLPLISVDEYESKVSDDACVFGFYVSGKEAAKDLNRFLQRSAVTIIDCDISPAPDMHGYFLCFCELLNNERLGKNVEAILGELTPLTGIDDWRLRVRGSDGLLAFSPDALEEALGKAAATTNEAAILEFLQASELLSAHFPEPKYLQLQTSSANHFYTVVGFGERNSVFETLNLAMVPVSFTLREGAEANRFAISLGAGWDVQKLKNQYYVVSRENSCDCLILSR